MVWKWPAILMVAAAETLATLEPGVSPAAQFIGATVGTAVAFWVGTWVYRKIRDEPGFSWATYAAAATLAGVGSFGAIATGGGAPGAFSAGYLLLLAVAWVVKRMSSAAGGLVSRAGA